MCKSISSVTQLAPNWYPALADFENEAFSSDLHISAQYKSNQAFNGSKSKLTHCKWKTIPILEIKHLVLILRFFLFDSPGIGNPIGLCHHKRSYEM